MQDNADLTNMTFDEIAAQYGLEAAIQAGIAADPDTWEFTEEDFAKMRPAAEVHPQFVAQWLRQQAQKNQPAAPPGATPA